MKESISKASPHLVSGLAIPVIVATVCGGLLGIYLLKDQITNKLKWNRSTYVLSYLPLFVLPSLLQTSWSCLDASKSTRERPCRQSTKQDPPPSLFPCPHSHNCKKCLILWKPPIANIECCILDWTVYFSKQDSSDCLDFLMTRSSHKTKEHGCRTNIVDAAPSWVLHGSS